MLHPVYSLWSGMGCQFKFTAGLNIQKISKEISENKKVNIVLYNAGIVKYSVLLPFVIKCNFPSS